MDREGAHRLQVASEGPRGSRFLTLCCEDEENTGEGATATTQREQGQSEARAEHAWTFGGH